MILLPLLTMPADPDAWHQVMAPGGYECWHLEAEDPVRRLRFAATFWHGHPFDREYNDRYARYRRRPTRHAPPTAGEYPCICVALYENEQLAAQLMIRVPSFDAHAATDRLDVRMGLHRVQRTADGALHLCLAELSKQSLSAELTFRQRGLAGAVEHQYLSRHVAKGDHRWLLHNPYCDVSGRVTLAGRELAFEGHGYCDHKYGTAPVGLGYRQIVSGSVIAKERVYAFQMAYPIDTHLPSEVHLFRADAGGCEMLAVASSFHQWKGQSPPQLISFPPYVQLSRPRVVDASRSGLTLAYDAQLDDGEAAVAICRIVHPYACRWPILGRVLMGFGKGRRPHSVL